MLQNIAIKNNKRLDLDAINRLIIRLIEIETNFKYFQTQYLTNSDI